MFKESSSWELLNPPNPRTHVHCQSVRHYFTWGPETLGQSGSFGEPLEIRWGQHNHWSGNQKACFLLLDQYFNKLCDLEQASTPLLFNFAIYEARGSDTMGPPGSASLGPTDWCALESKVRIPRKKSNQKRANQGSCFLPKSCFCVGQCAVGFRCILSQNPHDTTKRESLSFPFYRRHSWGLAS